MGSPYPRHPIRFHAGMAAALAALATLALWWWLAARDTWAAWLGCWLVAINVVTFAYYAFDKVRATGSVGRVPEAVLHGLSAAGGSPAALMAMQLLRHKTVKPSFRILFWCIFGVQLAIAAAALVRWMWLGEG